MLKLTDKNGTPKTIISIYTPTYSDGCLIEVDDEGVRQFWLPKTAENTWENNYFKLTLT
jgi:hypothetical protein